MRSVRKMLLLVILSAVHAADDIPRDVEIITSSPSPDHSLFARNIPAVHGFDGNFLHHYPFELRPLTALAVLQGGGDADESGEGVSGEILFVQPAPGAPVRVTGNITGLSPGLHGLHVHKRGDMRKRCESAGPHFNPYRYRHGGPLDPVRHVGDLGNIKAGDDGTAMIHILDPIISLSEGYGGIVGRSLVVHAMEDDFGRGNTPESLENGNSGMAIACGIIGYLH